MCTKIDIEATETKKKKLKSTRNVGWKIVVVRDGMYFAPMRYFQYLMSDKNTTTITPLMSYNEIGAGVFHLFRSRLITRQFLRTLQLDDDWGDKNLKIVKVFYDKKDFYGIGNANSFSDYLMNILKKHKNNSICVKAFTFAGK